MTRIPVQWWPLTSTREAMENDINQHADMQLKQATTLLQRAVISAWRKSALEAAEKAIPTVPWKDL